MGNNIYVWFDNCKCCKHPQKWLHLGKFSHGWRFALNVNHGYFNNLEAFKLWHTPDMFIVDENERVFTLNQLLREIKRKKNMKIRKEEGVINDDLCDLLYYEFV